MSPTKGSEIFVDTSAWIAISDVHDKYHAAAKTAVQGLITGHRRLVTSNLVVAECYILIQRTGSHVQAQRFLRSLRESPRLLKVYSDARLEAIAENLLESYTDQDFSYTDAVSFALMQEQDIQEAFTFDRHFATVGYSMLP